MKRKPTARADKPQNSKTRKPTAKERATPRVTAEQLSDKQRQELLLSHRRKCKPLIEAEKHAKAATAKAFELAKKEGFTKKDILLAIQLETEEGREKLQSDIQKLLDVDRYTGAHVGTQLELFAKQDSKARYFEDGRIAALSDQAAKPPSHLPQTAAKHWLDGHADGLQQQNRTRLGGFPKLGDVVKIGDQPATHKEAA